jgi:hypothetical protein
LSTYFAIDFETYYDDFCTVKLLGPQAYVRHPRFKAYLVAIRGPDVKYVGPPDKFDWSCLEKADGFVAHNAGFDQTVFDSIAPANGLLSRIPWFCTADLSVYLRAGRSLKDAAYDLLGIKIEKDMRDRMHGMSYEDAIARGWRDELHEYATRDAELCEAIWNKYHDQWPEREQLISALNRESGTRGIRIDRPRLEAGLTELSTVKFEAAKRIPWDWSDNLTPLSPLKLAVACRENGIEPPPSMAEDDERCVEWELKYGERFPWVSALRDWRKANILEKKLKTVQIRLDSSDTLCYEVKYFGAHTGRFSGSGGFNIQNLPRTSSYGVDLRGMIIPSEGHKLIVADLAQIEARILLFLAGDTKTLDQIRAGTHIYEAHARETMGWAGGKLKEENKDLYALAKARVLGAGYGCGPIKFKSVAKLMAGVDMTEEEAEKTIADFRASNPKIVSLWRRLQRDLFWAYQQSEPYRMILPSGRTLSYDTLTSTSEGMKACVEINGNKNRIYGGKLTENLVQATARGVFTEGLIRLKEAGYRLLFHVHDEYVLQALTDDLQTHVARVKKIIEEPVNWLIGCPIEVEVKVADRYEK